MRLLRIVQNWERQDRIDRYRTAHHLPISVDIDPTVDLSGTVRIGEMTYINGFSRIASGETSAVVIGRGCAIGRFVHIMAYTHDFHRPAGSTELPHATIEADIAIGDFVWIGDKVFIREGIRVGNYAVIGANSVVNRDVEDFEVVGGVPIRHIRFNTDHEEYGAKVHRGRWSGPDSRSS